MSEIQELARLSSESIARIYDALHDLKDGDLHEACLKILWDRHATVGGDWPEGEQEAGAISLVVDGVEQALTPRSRSYRVRRFCRSHLKTGPGDPSHRIARTIDWSYADPQGRQRRFHGIECACGASGERLHIGRVRCAPCDAHVWPVATIPGVNNGYPVFVVCKYAEHAQDPLHGPGSLGDRCICGGSLGKWNEWADTPTSDKYLSVQ